MKLSVCLCLSQSQLYPENFSVALVDFSQTTSIEHEIVMKLTKHEFDKKLFPKGAPLSFVLGNTSINGLLPGLVGQSHYCH